MVIDTSALLAIFYREDDADLFAAKLDVAEAIFIAAPTLTEALVAVMRKRGPQGALELEAFIQGLLIQVMPFTAEDAENAYEAYLRFGKGRHPARLNLGDSYSCALSKRLKVPLLYKGDDFAQTDVLKA